MPTDIVKFPVHSVRLLRRKLRHLAGRCYYKCFSSRGEPGGGYPLLRSKCARSACMCVFVGNGGGVCVCVCVCACMRACVCVCMRACIRACVCVCARARARVRACVRAQTSLWVPGCCFSVCQFHFVWLSMSSNVLLLCYWFLYEYLCIPYLCLVKWQRAVSRRTRTIKSMCMRACTETCEHGVPGYTAILIYIQSTRVCVWGGWGCVFVCVRACRRLCECEGIVFECVSVWLCFVWLSMCSNLLLC